MPGPRARRPKTRFGIARITMVSERCMHRLDPANGLLGVPTAQPVVVGVAQIRALPAGPRTTTVPWTMEIGPA